ncbi:hypothetical protein MZM54_05090 [[Brevibacterium] frigoritolerans]|nr:hypothetical protein [Peribacillus frigoritolerans]
MTQQRMKQMNVSDFYELLDEEKNNYLDYMIRKITREKNEKPLYYEMMGLFLNTAEHHFADFFVEDYNTFTINDANCSKFIWIVYKHRDTKLIRLESDFEEEVYRNFSFLQSILKSCYDSSSKAYLVDVRNQSIQELDLTKVEKSLFSHRCGKVQTYFDHRLRDIDYENYYTLINSFASLSSLYRIPPKPEIDRIFEEAV